MSLESTFSTACRALAPRVNGAVLEPLCLLLERAPAAQTYEAAVEWLVALVRWLRTPGPCTLEAEAMASSPQSAARLRLLIELLRRLPPAAAAVGGILLVVTDGSEKTSLFCESGIPPKGTFVDEGLERITRRLLPIHQEEGELARTLIRLFPDRCAAVWLGEIPAAMLGELLAATGADFTERRRELADAMAESLEVLAIRIAGNGMAEDIRRRSDRPVLHHSPYYNLSGACTRFICSRNDPAALPESTTRLQSLIADCKTSIEYTFRHLDQHGVSTEIVYRLELMRRNLDRLAALLGILITQDSATRVARGTSLLRELVDESIRSRSVTDLIRLHTGLVARKIVDHTAVTGDHYIAADRREWHAMVTAAAGGGALTAITVLIKYKYVPMVTSAFAETTFTAINYAGSFIAMQLLGFTLATKQPPMTASSLAAALAAAPTREGAEALARLTARITQSQLAGAFGNLGAVMPAAAAVFGIYHLLTGQAVLSPEKAIHVIKTLDPLGSPTIFYAIVTGVILWTGSMAAGWAQNAARYRQLPQALARSKRLQRFFQIDDPAKLAVRITQDIGGIASSVTLGFLLAVTPLVGKFFGVTMDVRHMTLSLGALTLAMLTLGPKAALDAGLISAGAGILVVAFFNFAVGFLLALGLAMKARGVSIFTLPRLLQALLSLMWREPISLLLPKGSSETVTRPH